MRIESGTDLESKDNIFNEPKDNFFINFHKKVSPFMLLQITLIKLIPYCKQLYNSLSFYTLSKFHNISSFLIKSLYQSIFII